MIKRKWWWKIWFGSVKMQLLSGKKMWFSNKIEINWQSRIQRLMNNIWKRGFWYGCWNKRDHECVTMKRVKIWFPVVFEKLSKNYKRNRFDPRHGIIAVISPLCLCCSKYSIESRWKNSSNKINAKAKQGKKISRIR